MSIFADPLKQLNDEFNAFMAAPSAGGSWSLSLKLQAMDDKLREHIQVMTRGEIEGIISKLSRNTPLDKSDMEFLRLWIIGDADHYVQLEDDYQEWIDEMRKLMGDVNKAGDPSFDYATAAKQRAYLLDGIRVLGDILFFLKQKERIANFTESTREIDDEERALLIDILKGKITSPKA